VKPSPVILYDAAIYCTLDFARACLNLYLPQDFSMRAVKYCLYREKPYFVAQGLSVDVSSFGKTREEAAANFREAVELYFEGEPNPDYIDISEITVGEELIGCLDVSAQLR
jgi:predicted RNase H-like HicB family nuclease